ncbi:MAG: aspartate kinase [Thermoanaerobaculia bacterium]|nr:aspartate kinase [Thermoanaerobaculia bacterium]MBP9824294.1 aspartate kinase [Thermoanaerobaculia bacterium]
MSWRVLKFGGTSVGSPEALQAACGIVRRAAAETRVLVVVSALAGVTSGIARQLETALARDPSWRDPFRALRARHREQLQAVARGRPAVAAADALDRGLERLRDLLRAVELLGEATPRTRARVMAAGERLSAPIFAAALAADGEAAAPLDGTEALVARGPYDEAFPDVGASRPKLAARLATLGDVLPVVTGFFGADAAGDVRLFGRGGSDTSATAIGAAIGAARVEIWTDVDGVATADPRRDPAAELLPRLSYDEAFRLARDGAKVLHWKAVAPARAAEVPIVVRNTFRPEAAGTWIGPDAAGTSSGTTIGGLGRTGGESALLC